MKKIITFMSILIFIFFMSISAKAETIQNDLISQWFSHAIKYASCDDFDNFANLYGDIDFEIIKNDFIFFKDKVYKQKYKCSFYVVSSRNNEQTIVDVIYHKKHNVDNGTIIENWYTSVMCFGLYKDRVVRIPKNYYLSNDYDNANNKNYIGGFINNEAWVKHNSGTLCRCKPTIRYAKLNKDGSISMIISIVNTHQYEVKAFCLYAYKDKSFVIFGGQYEFDLTKYIDMQKIPACKIKNYKITISPSKVSLGLTDKDILNCQFTLNYSYWAGDSLYYGYVKCRFDS